MRSKQILTAGAIAVLAAGALVGCVQSGSPNSDATAGSGAGVVKILGLSNNKLGFDTAIKRFEKANPDIDVQIDYQDATSLATTLRTQLLAGTAPDVFTTWPGYSTTAGVARLEPLGHLAGLDKLPFNAEIPKTFDSTTIINGERKMLPFSLNYVGAFYNVQAVKAAGAAVPTTWSEVLKFCDAAKAVGKVAFAYPAQTLWAVQAPTFALTSTLVYGQDPGFSQAQADGHATFSESKWSEALGKVLEMRDRGCFQQGFLGTPIEQAADQVAKGSAFAVISTSATLGTVAAAAGDPQNIGMFLLPATENPKDTWVPASAGNGLSVNTKAKNPVGAMRFIEFLSKPEEAAAAADAQNVAPVVSSAWTKPPVLEPLFEKIDAGRATTLIDQTWPNPVLAVNQQEGTQKLLGDGTTIADLLQRMDELFPEKK